MILSEFLPGQFCPMRDMAYEGALEQCPMDLGFFSRTKFKVGPKEPGVEPMVVELEGLLLTLRPRETTAIEVLHHG